MYKNLSSLWWKHKGSARFKECLEAESTYVKLQLGTMHGNTLMESAGAKHVVVTDLNSKSPVELPRVYMRK